MKKLSLSVGFLFFAVVLFVLGCEKMPVQGDDTTAKAQSSAPTVEAQQVTSPGTVATIVVGATPFSVEIAETDDERAKGLMNRESIPDNGGMWFVFPKSGQESFYMKDTTIPLDWIFVDENKKVVHIKENTTPNDVQPYTPPVAYKYALEVKAGMVAKNGIKIGDVVEMKIGPK